MESDKEMVKVASRIKWKITDSCPSKLFTADDILLQQVKNDNIYTGWHGSNNSLDFCNIYSFSVMSLLK